MMYQRVKDELGEIIGIVKECPEALQEKCFELLLKHMLTENALSQNATTNTKNKGIAPSEAESNVQHNELEISATDFHIKTRKFIENNGITIDDINQIYYMDSGNILPLYEDLKSTVISDCQIRLALLTAFEYSFKNDGEMLFDAEEVRKRCQEMKCYDGSNFTAILKRANGFFDDFDKYEKGRLVKLSADGKKELAKTIILLARGNGS